jgi:hypothetical protein
LGTGGNTLRGEGRNLFFAVQFGLWFFAFMLLESFINSNVADLFGASMVNAAYSMGIFCTATGLLVFGLVHAKAAAWCAKGLPAAAAVCAMLVSFVLLRSSGYTVTDSVKNLYRKSTQNQRKKRRTPPQNPQNIRRKRGNP